MPWSTSWIQHSVYIYISIYYIVINIYIYLSIYLSIYTDISIYIYYKYVCTKNIDGDTIGIHANENQNGTTLTIHRHWYAAVILYNVWPILYIPTDACNRRAMQACDATATISWMEKKDAHREMQPWLLMTSNLPKDRYARKNTHCST